MYSAQRVTESVRTSTATDTPALKRSTDSLLRLMSDTSAASVTQRAMHQHCHATSWKKLALMFKIPAASAALQADARLVFKQQALRSKQRSGLSEQRATPYACVHGHNVKAEASALLGPKQIACQHTQATLRLPISSIAGSSNCSIKIISSSNRNSSHSRASDSSLSERAAQVQICTMTTTAAVNAAAVHAAAAAIGDKAGWHTRDSDRDMMLLRPTRPNEVRWAVTPQVLAG